MSALDANVMRVFRSLQPEPPKDQVPELFEAHSTFLKEGDVLLHDEGGTGRSEQGDKAGKWTLRVLMRMNDGVAFAVKGGLLFSLTAKNRTFLFGCLEQQECVKWKTAFSTALALDTAAPPPSAKEHDHEVGGVLQGLKGALGAFADDEPVVEARKPAAPAAVAAASAAAAPKQATKAPAADDDDPFAAIARRPSKSAPPTTTTAAAPVLDLFGAPAAAPAAAPAPASGASALTGDALMKLYAQSAAVQPHVQTAPPHYANDFFATPASGFGAAPTQAGAFGGFGAPLATAQPQQQPALAPTPAPALAQQQQAKHDPFASLL